MTPHLLVVDDDRAFGEAIAVLLRHAGYRVSVADYFTHALAVLEQTPPPDMLITDIVMPDSINGAALGRMARMRNPRIGVIYVTGHDVPGLDREMIGPLLRKPVAEDRLLATVARQLSAQGAGRSSA